jgi:D-alanyl-D-alanine carboxypeptidase
MRTLLGVLGLVLSALAVTATPAVAHDTPSPAVAHDTPSQALERAVDDLVAAGAPGAVLLVRDGRRTLRIARGHADAAKGTPLRASDRFRAGSVTKTFVAAVVLQLAREGRLDLGDPVERWLPGAVPGGADITLRHLLNHTSGLFDYSEDPRTFAPFETDPDHRWDPRGLLAIAGDHRALFTPGADWSYSNTNYVALGLVVQAVTGRPLAAELRERIFEPAGLRHTTLGDGARIAGRHARGYVVDAAGNQQDVTDLSPSWAWAAGALVSTAGDLARFSRALLGGRLLGREQLAAMQTIDPVTRRAPGGAGYGLGLLAAPTACGRAWGHDGRYAGYTSLVLNRRGAREQMVLLVNQTGLTGEAARAYARVVEAAACPGG